MIYLRFLVTRFLCIEADERKARHTRNDLFVYTIIFTRTSFDNIFMVWRKHRWWIVFCMIYNAVREVLSMSIVENKNKKSITIIIGLFTRTEDAHRWGRTKYGKRKSNTTPPISIIMLYIIRTNSDGYYYQAVLASRKKTTGERTTNYLVLNRNV
jgi:hypothetical protein